MVKTKKRLFNYMTSDLVLKRKFAVVDISRFLLWHGTAIDNVFRQPRGFLHLDTTRNCPRSTK